MDVNSRRPKERVSAWTVVGVILALVGIIVSLTVPEIRALLPWVGESEEENTEQVGESTSGTTTPDRVAGDPGTIWFYDAGIEPNSVYPDVLRPSDQSPRLVLSGITNSGSDKRAVQVTFLTEGISKVQLTIRDPGGREILVSSEFVTVLSEMELVYEINVDTEGEFTFIVEDTMTGLSGQADIYLEYEEFSEYAEGVPVGSQPDLRVGAPSGRACDEKGALIPIIASQVDTNQYWILTAYSPDGIELGLGTNFHDYSGVIDDWGSGYYGIVVKAESCIGQSIEGFTAAIKGSDSMISFSVPN